jgi:hypothetical protein
VPVAGVVDVLVGAAPPVGAELPPTSPALVVGEEAAPVAAVFEESVDDDVSLELETFELESVELDESVLVVSPVVPVAVPVPEVVPVAAPEEFSSLARLAEAVGSTRLGIVRGTESETVAPPQALSTSPPRRAPRSAAGRARLGNASLRWGPCDARRSGSR